MKQFVLLQKVVLFRQVSNIVRDAVELKKQRNSTCKYGGKVIFSIFSDGWRTRAMTSLVAFGLLMFYWAKWRLQESKKIQERASKQRDNLPNRVAIDRSDHKPTMVKLLQKKYPLLHKLLCFPHPDLKTMLVLAAKFCWKSVTSCDEQSLFLFENISVGKRSSSHFYLLTANTLLSSCKVSLQTPPWKQRNLIYLITHLWYFTFVRNNAKHFSFAVSLFNYWAWFEKKSRRSFSVKEF